MTNDVRTVTDPLGNTIHMLQGIDMTRDEGDLDVYDDAATVIRKPAMLFEMKKDRGMEMFYFRSVGWERTMLIMVRLQDNKWETAEYIKNPSSEVLSDIIKKGKQLL